MKHLFFILIATTLLIAGCKKEKKQGLAIITTNAVTSITSTGVQSGGNITDDGGSTIVQRGMCWADHSGPTVADSITTDGNGSGSFTSSISGLNANTTYYLRAYAVNSSGTAYGDEVSFTTNAGLATISTTAISDIQPLSAKSGGNINNDGGANITERGVVYGTSPNPTTSNFKIVDAATGSGEFTITLSPLASQQTYYVRAYATNIHGTAYGNQLQFNAASANTVTDVDGNVYPYIEICGQTWMTTNLKTTKYRNGDPITNGSVSNFNWFSNTDGAYTFPNGEQTNNEQYGKLYNYEAIIDNRGVCPTGWHVATDTNWADIEVCYGMSSDPTSGNYYVYKVGVRIGPNVPELLQGGSTGLEITKAGQLFVDQTNGSAAWSGFGVNGIYWTSTANQNNLNTNWYRLFNRLENPTYVGREVSGRAYVLSVRCVKD